MHLIVSGCRLGCSSWPLPLPAASRRLASALLRAIASHSLMLLPQCLVHPPRTLISLESTPPNTGPELSPPLHCLPASPASQETRPLSLFSTLSGVPKGEVLSPSCLLLSILSYDLLPAGMSTTQIGVNKYEKSTHPKEAHSPVGGTETQITECATK